MGFSSFIPNPPFSFYFITFFFVYQIGHGGNIDSSLDYMRKFKKPCNSVQCTKICEYYPDEDEAFLYFLSDKKEEYANILANFNIDKELHNWVMMEIENRKSENTEILKAYDLYN